MAAINTPDGDSLCGYCIAAGWTYCQKTEDFPYATHDDFLYTSGGFEETGMGTGDYECEDPALPDYAVQTNYPTYMCTTGASKAVAMSMCNFNRDFCSETREYTKDLTESKSVFAITDMQAELSCSYKLETTSGAPGFNFDMSDWTHNSYAVFAPGSRPEVASPQVQESHVDTAAFEVYWTEYDYFHADLWSNTTWPTPDLETVNIHCHDCAPGSLMLRALGQGANSETINANHILLELNEKRREIEAYQKRVEQIQTYNDNIAPGLLGVPLLMPVAPEEFDDASFENTYNIGGYGAPTSGNYHLYHTKKSGFKPYGALGAGQDNNLGVRDHTTDMSRFMIVAITNMGGSDQQNYANQGEIRVELGAYPWSDKDLTTPEIPVDFTVMSQGAAKLAVAGASLLALCLY
jgi:hypothetical protein